MKANDYAQAKQTDFDAIPIVGVSNIATDTGFSRCAQEMIDAEQNVGFFYLSGHGIPQFPLAPILSSKT